MRRVDAMGAPTPLLAFAAVLMCVVGVSGSGPDQKPRLTFATKLLPPFIEWGEGLSLDAGGVAVPDSAGDSYYWDGWVNVTLAGAHISPPPKDLRRPTLTGFSREYLGLLFETSRLAGAAAGIRPPETALYDTYSGYDLILCASNTEMFRMVDRGRADMAHAGISVTTSRMARRHFSKPFFPSSISLMVWDDRDLSGSSLAFLKTFGLAILSQAMPVFLALVFLAANLVWSAEHFFPDTKRSLFAATYCKGIWQAMEWAGRKLIGDTTLKDVPFGQWGPRAAMVITGLAFFLQSFLTGAVTTGMQGVELHSTIRDLGDLGSKNVPVGSVVGTTSSSWLVDEGSRAGISNVHLYPDYATALNALRNRSVAGLIYDFAPQRHVERLEATAAARKALPPPFTIVDPDITRENYGIAAGQNITVALRVVDLAVVAVEGSPKYDALYARFLAPVDENTASVAASFVAFDLSWVAALWGGGAIVVLVVAIFICYRVRLAVQLGGCRRDPTKTRPRSIGSRARESLSRTQTFMGDFRGRGHGYDERIRTLEAQAADEDRYFDDPAAIRQTMSYSRDTNKKLMGLLDIMEGLKHHFSEAPLQKAASPASLPAVSPDRDRATTVIRDGKLSFRLRAPADAPARRRFSGRRSNSFDDLRMFGNRSSSDAIPNVETRTPSGTDAPRPPPPQVAAQVAAVVPTERGEHFDIESGSVVSDGDIRIEEPPLVGEPPSDGDVRIEEPPLVGEPPSRPTD